MSTGKNIDILPQYERDIFQWLAGWLPEQDIKTKKIIKKHMLRSPERWKNFINFKRRSKRKRQQVVAG